MNRPSNLSRGILVDLFKQETVEKKMLTVDYKLQVLSIKKNDQQKSTQNAIYTATLSDGDYKYTGFILIRDNSSPYVEDGDILSVTGLKQASLNSMKSKVFLIQKYDILEKQAPQVGTPELIKDENASKSKEALRTNASNMSINQNNSNNKNSNYNYNSNYNQNYNSSYQNMNQRESSSHDYDNSDARPRFFMPLTSLTTFTKDINIKVRVLKKGDIKDFNGKNPGKLFSFNILDDQGTEMQVTCFTRACEKFYNLIQEKKIYEIQGGYIKPADKKFSSVRSEYKMILDENCRVEEVDDDNSINTNAFNFIKIADLLSLNAGAIVDIMGYVVEVQDKQIKTTRFGECAIKKAMLVDDSEHKVELTLWKQYADLEIQQGQVICLKGAKVGDFNGRSLSTLDQTDVLLDNHFNEAMELKFFAENYQGEWKTFSSMSTNNNTNQDSGASNPNVTKLKDALGVLESGIPDDQITSYKVKVTVCNFIHSDRNFYAGCPEKSCKKKVGPDSYNTQCNYCNKQINKPVYYYTLNLRVKDCSGEQYVDVFGDLGNKLLKIPCEEYRELVTNNDLVRLNQISENVEFKTFLLVGKPKMNIYNGNNKKKFNVFKVEPVDTNNENKRMTKMLSSLLLKK